MIKSMTAFGRSKTKLDNRAITVEIRSLNHRYRDIVVRLPRYLIALENRTKKLIEARVFRGSIELTVDIKHDKESNIDLRLNVPLAESYYFVLKKLKEALKIEEPISLDTILAYEGIISAEDVEIDPDQFWDGLSLCIGEALDTVEEMKRTEGIALCKDLLKRISGIEERLNKIREMSSSLSLMYYNRLKERVVKLTEDMVEVDPNRLAQEAAFLADKSDISEEIVRLSSHLQQFRSIIDSEEPSGRPLNFLLQEMNRESNTIGSKIGDVELSQVVVGIKSELEKIREQVQNVE